MPQNQQTPILVFPTPRLLIQKATIDDADMFYFLWTNPAVMKNVGFPNGLPITRPEIEEQLKNQGAGVYGRLLVVVLQATGERIGECYMTQPNAAGVSVTDVKLLPTYWGHKYGVEIKRGLLNYLFSHTECSCVQATPNINNIASIKMQEAVGGIRAGTGKSLIPQAAGAKFLTVDYPIYRVYRRIWQKAQRQSERTADDAG